MSGHPHPTGRLRQLRPVLVGYVLFLALLAISARGGVTLTTVFSFAGTNGSTPIGTLVQRRDGNFYGVTQNGGISNAGTVFRLTSDGILTTLVNFTNTNGAWPHAGLVQGTDGNFYGTTTFGGAYGPPSGNGTVFKMTPDGTLTTLSSFAGTNGAAPESELVEGADGNFYGTASAAGQYTNAFGNGYGTVFRITSAGELSTLMYFDGTNGGAPWAALARGVDGDFYGNSRIRYDGSATNNFGIIAGTLFRLGTNGVLTTLMNFDGTNSGASRFALVQATDGSFYEMSDDSGTNLDSNGMPLGRILRLRPDGTSSIIHAFNGTDGGFPRGLMLASDGNFYGMTGFGGAGYTGSILGSSAQSGTVFKMTPDGAFTTLVVFTNGERPFGGLLQASDGNLYGATIGGGVFAQGSIFRLSVPMPAKLLSVAKLGGTLTSSWSVVAGQMYQAQYCADLAKGNWLNLASSTSATNGTLVVSDVVSADPQRFYRLALLP